MPGLRAEIPKDHRSSLGAWLPQVAVGISIQELNDREYLRWGVEVHNGLDGDDAMGTLLAVTGSELEAELIATALWALVEKERVMQ